MFHYAHSHPFDVTSNPFHVGLAAAGGSPFLCQPWPPLGPGILASSLMTVAAATAGNWLAGLVSPLFNAAMTPALHGFPPVMQAALPLSQPEAEAGGMIAFAELMRQGEITDLIVAEDRVPGALLAGLRQPGNSMSWEVTRPDGPSRKVAFHRVDAPTDDGSWLLRADLSEGGRTKSSQLIRVHDAIADPRRPQGFRDDVARAYDTWTRHAADGENANMAVVCENGAGLSGTAITLLHRRSQEQSRASHGEAGVAVPRQEVRRAETEYNNECVRTRGSGFARGHDMYLNVDAGRTSDLPRGVQGQRMRTGSPPLESLHRSPFISSERREREAAAAAAAGDGSRRSSVGYGDSGNYSDSYSDSDTYSDSSSSGSYSVRSASQSGSEPSSLVDHDQFDDEVFEPLSAEEQSFDFVEDASTRTRLADRSRHPGIASTRSDAEVQADEPAPVVAQQPRTPVRPPAPDHWLLDAPIANAARLPQPLIRPVDPEAEEVNRLLAQLPPMATHDFEVEARKAEQLRNLSIEVAMARLPKPPTTLPRSSSAPNLLRRSADAEAETTRTLTDALADARAASEPDLRAASRERPLQKTMAALFSEIDASLGLASTLKRTFTFGNGKGRWADQIADRMMPIVKQLRDVYQTREGSHADAGGEAQFISQNLAKAARNGFNGLGPATRLRLVDAFHRQGGELPAMHDARDGLVRTMTTLSNNASVGARTLSEEFRVAQLRHEALNYTIAAMEFAVPSKQTTPT